jgi:hypothetical protein
MLGANEIAGALLHDTQRDIAQRVAHQPPLGQKPRVLDDFSDRSFRRQRLTALCHCGSPNGALGRESYSLLDSMATGPWVLAYGYVRARSRRQRLFTKLE